MENGCVPVCRFGRRGYRVERHACEAAPVLRGSAFMERKPRTIAGQKELACWAAGLAWAVSSRPWSTAWRARDKASRHEAPADSRALKAEMLGLVQLLSFQSMSSMTGAQ